MREQCIGGVGSIFWNMSETWKWRCMWFALLTGVGRNLANRLHTVGAYTCSDLKRFTETELQRECGAKTGNALYRHCRGEDDRALNFDYQRKSVSAEVNYGIRFTNQEEADAFLKQLAGEVSSRLRNIKLKGRCITLKLMVSVSANCENSWLKLYVKCCTLYHPTYECCAISAK
jgi:nucleotidyltransferase/DNA polymerase involved in DNA repair